jgi:PST family polysaccharide transporter
MSLSDTVALLPIFLLIQHPQDAVWVLLVQGMGAIVGGVLALYWMHREALIEWRPPTWAATLAALQEGGALFGSRAAISLYTALVPLVLGWLAGPVALAYFNLANQLRSGAQSILTPISQALFPRMSHLVGTNADEAYSLVQRTGIAVMLVAGSASVALWALADSLVFLLGGKDFLPAADVLRWLAPLPLAVGLSNVLGTQVMLPHGLNRPFNIVLLSAAGLSVALLWPLVSNFMAIGAAQTILIVEVWVTTAMAAFLWHQGYFKPQKWKLKP